MSAAAAAARVMRLSNGGNFAPDIISNIWRLFFIIISERVLLAEAKDIVTVLKYTDQLPHLTHTQQRIS